MNGPSSANQLAPALGRILLSAIFILAGIGKIQNFDGTAMYMASHGLPMAKVLLVPTILIELGGGLMLLLGWHARWAAGAIFLFIIPVTLVFHAFWAADPAHYQGQFINFMKNLAIMGGMAYVVAYGAGPYRLGKGEGR